jgi:hypothetical protein
MKTDPNRLAAWVALADAALYLRGYANGGLDLRVCAVEAIATAARLHPCDPDALDAGDAIASAWYDLRLQLWSLDADRLASRWKEAS